jgi:hypothetical protein
VNASTILFEKKLNRKNISINFLGIAQEIFSGFVVEDYSIDITAVASMRWGVVHHLNCY